jgi:hypothetical protein
MKKPTIPTPMLHGSGKSLLMANYVDQIAILQNAMTVMGQAAPHGRDYRDPDEWRTAASEHRARLMKIHDIIAELTTIAEAIR